MSANTNVKPSSIFKPIGQGAPISIAAAGTLKTAWVKVDVGHWLYLLVTAGVIDGTAVVTWQQSAASDGSNPKNLDTGDFATIANGGTATPAFTATDDGKTMVGVGRVEQLDLNGGFAWVMATLTVTGGTGSLFSMVLLAGPVWYET